MYLLKQRPFSELTEEERTYVLKIMTSDDYTMERQIVLLSEKLKKSQEPLKPYTNLKDQLSAKMQAPSRRNHIRQFQYHIAASLFFFVALFYFWNKNKVNNVETIVSIDIKNENIKVESDQLPFKIPTQSNKKIQKTIKKRSITIKKISEEDDISLTFNRKNPNLEWQTEDANEVVPIKHILQCKPF